MLIPSLVSLPYFGICFCLVELSLYTDVQVMCIYVLSVLVCSSADKYMALLPLTSIFSGWDVEIHEDVLVIGALQDREGKIGSAYIYRRNPDTTMWEFEHKLAPPNDENKIFNFGMVIAIRGNRIAVGDRSYGLESNESGPARKGAVWLYDYDPVSKEWTQPFGEVMTSEVCDNWFGVMLAFTYDYGLLVGCAQDDFRAGSVHYYEPSDKGYVFKQTVVASFRAKNDFFGNLEQISVYGNVMVVGIDKNKDGKVFVFLRKDGVWVEEAIIESPNEDNRKFGNRVRMSENNIIVSSWYNAYFYELTEGGEDSSSTASCITSQSDGAIYEEDCTTCVK